MNAGDASGMPDLELCKAVLHSGQLSELLNFPTEASGSAKPQVDPRFDLFPGMEPVEEDSDAGSNSIVGAIIRMVDTQSILNGRQKELVDSACGFPQNLTKL